MLLVTGIDHAPPLLLQGELHAAYIDCIIARAVTPAADQRAAATGLTQHLHQLGKAALAGMRHADYHHHRAPSQNRRMASIKKTEQKRSYWLIFSMV